MEKEIPKEENEIVLCIPITFETREELFAEVIKNNLKDYLFAGMVLMNTQTNEHFGCEICKRDPRMKKAFELSGKVNHLSASYLEEIDAHNLVVYLSGKSGNFEQAHAIAKAAGAILNSGGIGVKVESAGKAFTAKKWYSLSREFDKMNLYELFVVETIYDEETMLTYSCGMHNIGHKDVAIQGESFTDAYPLIRMFNVFRFVDEPILNENETFSLSMDADRYRLSNMENPPTKGEGLFENQFGFWELIKLENNS